MIIEKIINHDGKKYPMNIVHFPRNEIDTYSYCDREKIRKILFDCGFWGADISSFFLCRLICLSCVMVFLVAVMLKWKKKSF